jgi:hypothetical protein
MQRIGFKSLVELTRPHGLCVFAHHRPARRKDGLSIPPCFFFEARSASMPDRAMPLPFSCATIAFRAYQV